MTERLPDEDIVTFWNRLSKVELWSLEHGDVNNLVDEAVEEIERLRSELKSQAGIVRQWSAGHDDIGV